MIIARFGPTWDTAYPFGIVKGADDWQAELTDTVVRVGGQALSFSIEGQALGPVTPIMVRKSWLLGPGLIAGEHDRILYGTGEMYGVGTLWGQVGGWTWSWGDLDQTLDYLRRCTLTRGETKLWGLTRDEQHRWIWAKAISGRFPESVQTKLRIPVELDFYCREGIWYGEERQGLSLVSTLPATYTAVNSGDRAAALQLNITPAIGTLTSITLTNAANGNTFTWTGSAEPGQLISIDTAAWRVQVGARSGYSGFTYGATQGCWNQLEPGSNTLTLSVGGASSWSGSLTWWSTYQ